MVEVEELANIALRALNEILEAHSDDSIDEYLSEALGVSAKVAIVDGSPMIEEIELTRTVGGPNVYVSIKPDMIKVEVWWGTQSYRLTYDGKVVKKIFEELEEMVREMLRESLC